MLNMLQIIPFLYPWITVPPNVVLNGQVYWNFDYQWYRWLITANPFMRLPGGEEGAKGGVTNHVLLKGDYG